MFVSGAHKRKEQVTTWWSIVKIFMGCGRGNDVTYSNKASLLTLLAPKLALFGYVMSFPLPHPAKTLTMLHHAQHWSYPLLSFMGSCLCAPQCLSTRSLASRRFASEETSGETPIKFVSIRWNVSVTCIVDNSKDSRDLVTNAISTVQVSHVPSYNNLEALQGKLEKCYNVQVWFLP